MVYLLVDFWSLHSFELYYDVLSFLVLIIEVKMGESVFLLMGEFVYFVLSLFSTEQRITEGPPNKT